MKAEYATRIGELESGNAKLEADLKDTIAKSHQTKKELNISIKSLTATNIAAVEANDSI